MKVFVLGNGESRLKYRLDVLGKQGRIYGCNALYRDFNPDVLVAIDRHMVDEIVASGYSDQNTCYFANDSRAHSIPDHCLVGERERTQYCGPTAIRLAIELEKPEKIFLVGFDIVDTKWSNVYVGTNGYADNRELARQAVTAGQNIVHNPATLQQLRDIFIEFPTITFCKVMETNQFKYTDWQGIPNLVYLNESQFKNITGHKKSRG